MPELSGDVGGPPGVGRRAWHPPSARRRRWWPTGARRRRWRPPAARTRRFRRNLSFCVSGCFKNENVKMALKMFDEMPQKDVVYNLMIYGLMKCGLCIDAMDFFDLSALNVLFSNLNSPSQLQGWTANGGDPCGQSWEGVTCFGSSVKAIK